MFASFSVLPLLFWAILYDKASFPIGLGDKAELTLFPSVATFLANACDR